MYVIFSIPQTLKTARAIARLGRGRLGQAEFGRYPDGERWIKLKTPVSRNKVVVVGATGPDSEVLWDTLGLIRACKINRAPKITVLIPYFSYARQDKLSPRGEVPLLNLVAELLETAGANEVVLLDPHSPQSKRAFSVPVNMAEAAEVLAVEVKKILPQNNLAVAAPDYGARDRAKKFARIISCPTVITLQKIRLGPAQVAAFFSAKDKPAVAGKNVVLVDDIISTAKTMAAAAKLLKNSGARRIYAVAAHGILAGRAAKLLAKSGVFKIFITNSIKAPRRRPNVIVVPAEQVFLKFLR